MATARWHLLSAWGLLTAALSKEIRHQIAANPTLIDEEPAARAYYRALNTLKTTQKERITKRTQADPMFK